MQQKKRRKYSLLAGLILFALVVAYVVTNLRYFNGVVGFQIGLREARPRVFVSPDIDKQTIDSLLTTIDSAVTRNKAFWNSTVDLPKIIYCHNQEMAERYTTGNAHAESFFTVFGRHVVVTETGLNTDIISHELAHVALFDRIPHFKWYMMTYRVPVWFDEGIAMQVDYRDNYSTEKYLKHTDNGAKAPTLVSMASLSDFYQPDTLGWYRYATAKHEVARWLHKVDKKGLDKLIQSTTIFSDFDSQYQLIEATTEKH